MPLWKAFHNGKTQLAKVLAEYLFSSEDKLIRYDMSEYNQSDGVSRLIGEKRREWERGKLIEDIIANPFSVILFDEIEKAHPDIFNLLLQIIGEGRLTDSSGNTYFFQNSIIILTSNLGAEVYSKRQIGMKKEKDYAKIDYSKEIIKSIELFFRPEFINRLTEIVYFKPLTLDVIKIIAKKELEYLFERTGITRRQLKITYDSSVLELLLNKGYEEKYGARPMKRAIEKYISNPLAEFISKNPTTSKKEVKVEMKNDNVFIQLEKNK